MKEKSELEKQLERCRSRNLSVGVSTEYCTLLTDMPQTAIGEYARYYCKNCVAWKGVDLRTEPEIEEDKLLDSLLSDIDKEMIIDLENECPDSVAIDLELLCDLSKSMGKSIEIIYADCQCAMDVVSNTLRDMLSNIKIATDLDTSVRRTAERLNLPHIHDDNYESLIETGEIITQLLMKLDIVGRGGKNGELH